MNWLHEEVTIDGKPAHRVYNDDNAVEFMCADWWDARDLIIALQRKTLDMYVPGYGYEQDEFKAWKEAEEQRCHRGGLTPEKREMTDKLIEMAGGDPEKAVVLLKRYMQKPGKEAV